jgi:hypothetical protein
MTLCSSVITSVLSVLKFKHRGAQRKNTEGHRGRKLYALCVFARNISPKDGLTPNADPRIHRDQFLHRPQQGINIDLFNFWSSFQ